MMIRTYTLFALFTLLGSTQAQNTFEITIPVPGLTDVAGGHQLPDGGFVFGGELTDGLVVIRTDSTGGVLWTRSLAEAANDEGLYNRSIAVSGDRIFMGGYALGPGTSSRDGILHVLDLDGNVLSQRLIDVGGGSNAIHSITGTANGALIAGRATGAGSYDMLLQQVDIDGNITGSWSYGSTGWDWAYEAVALSNGDMTLVGYGDDVGGPAPSAYLVRTDALGQELWARGLDGASADEAYTVMEDGSTGDLYMGGTSLGMGSPGTRGFISKFSADGTHQWTRKIDNAFDVIGLATIVPGRYAAVLRAQNISGGHGNYDVLIVLFNGAGELLSNRLFGSAASEYPVAMSRATNGGLLVSSLKSGSTNAIHAVLTDEFGNGGCTGIPVTVQWSSYTPTLFNHTSTLQVGQSTSSWVTPSTQPGLTRQFECCTYPVEASFTAAPTGDPLTWTFTSTALGSGELGWTIAGTSYTGATATHTFIAPGPYQACLTSTSVCASDEECTTIEVISTSIGEINAEGLRLWPVPASDRVFLSADRPILQVRIHDLGGRVLAHIPAQGGQLFDIPLDGVAPGSYIVLVDEAGRSRSLRMQVVR